MKKLVFGLGLIALCSATSGAGLTQDTQPRVGVSASKFQWTDEAGVTHKLSEFAGYPVVLLPIYTHCPRACVTNVACLKEAVSGATADSTRFRVLLFSFDPADAPDILARYRLRERIPLSWSLGTGLPGETRALLESIGFQYGKAGREFAHPNMVIFLDSDLRLAKWIYGSEYSARDFDAALQVAAGGNDWIGRHSDLLYALLLFALSVGCVGLIHHLLQWLALRRTRAATANST